MISWLTVILLVYIVVDQIQIRRLEKHILMLYQCIHQHQEIFKKIIVGQKTEGGNDDIKQKTD